MSSRKHTFKQFPWNGGKNTSLDPATVPPNQVIKADNVLFATRVSRQKRFSFDRDWDAETDNSDLVIGHHDYWYGTSGIKTHVQVAIHDSKTVYSYDADDGTRSADLFAGTAWSSDITQATTMTFNNDLIIAVDGTGNILKRWDGTTFEDLPGTPPQASMLGEHLGRMWTNDKTDVDRLHYSTTGDGEEWNGLGDSGAIDIGTGDGDPDGITAIFPSHKGFLYVAKRTKLYRIEGFYPETFRPVLVSNGIGCVGPNAVAQIDEDDIFFVSQKGVHSLAATEKYGSMEETYVSFDVQEDFDNLYVKSRLKFAWAAYLPQLNSIGFTFTDKTKDQTFVSNTIALYNIPLKSWYDWPDTAQTLIRVDDSDRERFYFGTNTGRIVKTNTGRNEDTSSVGANQPILYTIKSGLVYVDNDPYTVKAFKGFGLFYSPRADSIITVTIRIDDNPVQSIAFDAGAGGDKLDSTFILDTSVLGAIGVSQPQVKSIDGYGRGLQFTITQSGNQEEVEIQGYFIDWEPTGTAAEVEGAD